MSTDRHLGLTVDENEPIPLNISALVGTHVAVVGNAGSGKSGLLRRLLEVTHGYIQHIILDVEDEFYTLRQEFPYVILGGENGDAPITIDGAGELALTILRTGMSAVIQLNDFHAEDQERFIARFLEAMMSAPRDLWGPALVVLDEAHRLAPQDGETECSAAVKDLTARGRKRGFTAVLATQRMAKIDKNVTGDVNNWFLGRVGQATDRRVAADALGFSPSSKEGRELQSMPNRTFWCMGPATTRVPTQFSVAETETTIIQAGGGEVTTPPAPEELREILAGLAQAAREAAAAKEAQEKEDAARRAAQRGETVSDDDTTIDTAAIRQEGYNAGFREGEKVGKAVGRGQGLRQAVMQMAGLMNQWKREADELDPPPAPMEISPLDRAEPSAPAMVIIKTGEAIKTPALALPQPKGNISRPAMAILKAIEDFWPKAVPFMVAARHARVGLKSSKFRTYEPEVMSTGQVEKVGEKYRAIRDKPTGANTLGAYQAMMAPSWWAIVQQLTVRDVMSKDELITGAGISPTSSGGPAALRGLVEDFELLEKMPDGRYRLAEAFR